MTNNERDKYISSLKPTVSRHEKQVILGTLLGTASLIKPAKGVNAYLQMRESKSTGGKVLMYKAEELKKFARLRPLAEDGDSYHWVSKSDEMWNDFHKMCYKDGSKNITMDWLNLLADIGWAVWYMDKGFHKNGRAHLKVARVSKEGVITIERYFNELEFPCEVKGTNVIFTEKASEDYFKLILPCFPNSLLDSTPFRIPNLW